MRALLIPRSLSQRSAHERTRRFTRMEAGVESLAEEVEQ
jgi:hypothetical protein